MRADCNEALDLCDRTIDAKNKALVLKDLAITACRNQAVTQQGEINGLKDSANSMFRNPVVIGALGILAGLALSKYLFNK